MVDLFLNDSKRTENNARHYLFLLGAVSYFRLLHALIRVSTSKQRLTIFS